MESYWKLAFFVWCVANILVALGVGAFFMTVDDIVEITIAVTIVGFVLTFPAFLILALFFRYISARWKDPIEQLWRVMGLHYLFVSAVIIPIFVWDFGEVAFVWGPVIMMVLSGVTWLGMRLFGAPPKVSEPSSPKEKTERKERLLPVPLSLFEESALFPRRDARQSP
ncbi:MAG: hypothetical protein VX278_00230 [Myxococcota bacterium]|nr:hypothetical protein [Myxococcota bacterium]